MEEWSTCCYWMKILLELKALHAAGLARAGLVWSLIIWCYKRHI